MTSPEKSSRSPFAIWLGIGVVVLGLALVAIVVSQGGSDGDDTAGGSGSGSGGGSTTVTVQTSTDPGSAAPLPIYNADADPDPAVGKTIPTVTGQDFAGDDLTIGPDGKAKIILFVAHWCPHCQREVPLIKAHLDDNPMPDDVELLTVSTAVQPGAENYPPQEWLEKEGWSAPVLADETGIVGNTFGLASFPYFVVVDADGKVVERTSGEISTDQFDGLIEAAQTGET